MSTDPIQSYFTEKRRWQSWLDVEGALARVQAEAGIIPDWAGPVISVAANLDSLDLDALQANVRKTMAPVYALSRALAAASGPAGDWVHWGATTQNVIDAGRLLVLKDVQREIKERLGDVLRCLADMAETHSETPMVGRTNRQHALPITFGFKIAGWIDELVRVCDQLEECEDRLFVLRFGGAIGTFQSLGEAGLAISTRLAEELGLKPALYEGRAQVDVYVEYVSRLGMLGVAATRIAGELYEAMQSEIRELAEDLGHDVVGSSTMPHKVNPKLVVTLKADANRLRALGASAFAITPPSFEGDAVTNCELRELVEDTVSRALSVSSGLKTVLDAVAINADRMAVTLSSSAEETALESVMMHLAPKIGRAAAHDVLHEAATCARDTGTALQTLVQSMPEVKNALDGETLARLFDPVLNTGQSAHVARQLVALGRERAKGLTSGPSESRKALATFGSAAQRS